MGEQSTFKRTIKRSWSVSPKPGSGSHLQVARVLEPGHWAEFDPFLVMMEDWFRQGTFGFHPHRGIETVTFVLEGSLKHEDNHGGRGVLRPGDVQWMTAGRGIIHSEDPLPGETVHSLQLWINLPKSAKMTEPRYQDLQAQDAPVRRVEGGFVRVFGGASGDTSAATLQHQPVKIVEIVLDAEAILTEPMPADYNGFLYILEGNGHFGKEQSYGEHGQVLWLDRSEEAAESELTIQAKQPLRALLIAGKPIGEPVVAYGPFVMNSREEIVQAYADYEQGKFGPIPQ
ncbi:pirin family protein [Paenibacillus chartarius]|uniref:Pirin family protein n=1 Tax=Paenibacillus chartarius TaxID=747481 RepID=A0ABV6DIW9_9BACL